MDIACNLDHGMMMRFMSAGQSHVEHMAHISLCSATGQPSLDDIHHHETHDNDKGHNLDYSLQ